MGDPDVYESRNLDFTLLCTGRVETMKHGETLCCDHSPLGLCSLDREPPRLHRLEFSPREVDLTQLDARLPISLHIHEGIAGLSNDSNDQNFISYLVLESRESPQPQSVRKWMALLQTLRCAPPSLLLYHAVISLRPQGDSTVRSGKSYGNVYISSLRDRVCLHCHGGVPCLCMAGSLGGML